jgi:GTP:adenosylcobinamide-phosphate guanylyltransferase
VIAGGRARRMGAPKPLAGAPLIERPLAAAHE